MRFILFWPQVSRKFDKFLIFWSKTSKDLKKSSKFTSSKISNKKTTKSSKTNKKKVLIKANQRRHPTFQQAPNNIHTTNLTQPQIQRKNSKSCKDINRNLLLIFQTKIHPNTDRNKKLWMEKRIGSSVAQMEKSKNTKKKILRISISRSTNRSNKKIQILGTQRPMKLIEIQD